ncbi:DUF4012 domain-containing protein [Bifidobacterium sp. BRDM6]|uniref:DUF4012 domain-containing protein n=2 Tax=Bifidobacterium choloepi TaxID=2614131 RepID=A0A6I5N176_9BIFI|nr:DUF4012 domain-containing protein [Bifidobacterium choloepi]
MSRKERRKAAKKRNKRKVWPWVLGIVIVLILALAAVGGYFGLKFYKEAQEVKAHEEKAISLIGNISSASDLDNLSSLSSKISDVQSETSQAKDIAHGSLWNFMAKLLWIGDDVTTVQGMTDAVDTIANGAVPQFIDVVKTLESSSLTTADGSLNLQPIIDSQANMKAANSVLQTQVDEYNSLPTTHISTVTKAYEAGQTELNSLATTINRLSNTFAMLPGLLGSDGQQDYAVMAVTQSELRSSGGLVGSVGLMTTDDGQITVGDFHSNSDYMAQYSGSADLSNDAAKVFKETGPMKMSFDIRDIAALPNTADVASAMRSIWNKTSWGAGTTLDGVLVLDPVFLQELIGINGNVTLSNGTVLTGENTAEYLLNTVYVDYGNNNAAHNAIFAETAEAAIAEMFDNMNVAKLIKTGNALAEMAEQRHFSMYSFNEDIEQNIAAAGFTATVPSSASSPTIGVYLNEQQGSKMGWYLERKATITTNSCGSDNTTAGASYHVDYVLTNTMTTEEAASLPTYITGTTKGQEGWLLEKTLIYGPVDGAISGLTITGSGSATTPTQVSMDGSEPYMSTITLKPGQTMTISFDVRVSSSATSVLAVDQTPLNSTETNVTYEGKTCAVASGK